MLIKELVIANTIGEEIEFGRYFHLKEGLDLSNLNAENNYSKANIDGAMHQNTLLDIRDFDLHFYLDIDNSPDWWIEEKRQELFRVFNPKMNPMKITFKTQSGKEYYLTANLEGAPSLPQDYENSNEAWQNGLLQFTCGEPLIYSTEDTATNIANWIANFSFDLEIPEDGIELEYREQSLIQNVINDGSSEIGMDITFKALADVLNPQLINVNTYEFLKLNFQMLAGDVIQVVTSKGHRSITLTRNNQFFNIFNAFTLDSTFLQLRTGDNLFRYDAEEGIDFLEILIKHRNSFVGV